MDPILNVLQRAELEAGVPPVAHIAALDHFVVSHGSEERVEGFHPVVEDCYRDVARLIPPDPTWENLAHNHSFHAVLISYIRRPLTDVIYHPIEVHLGSINIIGAYLHNYKVWQIATE